MGVRWWGGWCVTQRVHTVLHSVMLHNNNKHMRILLLLGCQIRPRQGVGLLRCDNCCRQLRMPAGAHAGKRSLLCSQPPPPPPPPPPTRQPPTLAVGLDAHTVDLTAAWDRAFNARASDTDTISRRVSQPPRFTRWFVCAGLCRFGD